MRRQDGKILRASDANALTIETDFKGDHGFGERCTSHAPGQYRLILAKSGIPPPSACGGSGYKAVITHLAYFGSQKSPWFLYCELVGGQYPQAWPVFVSTMTLEPCPTDTWYLPMSFEDVAAPIAKTARTPIATPHRTLLMSIWAFIILVLFQSTVRWVIRLMFVN